MDVYFFDSSALVKCYIDEDGTDEVTQIILSDARVVVSRLTQLEVTSALARRRRDRVITAQECDAVVQALDVDLRERLEIMELSNAIVSRGVALVRNHALRAGDAIQLASALLAVSTADDESITFVCFDAALNAAAEKEGFEILKPQQD